MAMSNPQGTLTRNSTQPSNIGASPREAVLQRQLSAQAPPSPAAPVTATLTSYIKYLLGLSAKPTKRTLSEEAECGTPESIGEWLRLGSDANEIDAYGYTPLVNACLRGCLKSVRILIQSGADINMQAMHGYTPLHAAAQNGYLEIVEQLLDSGALLETKNDDGDTALMLAVRSEHAAVVDALCKRGSNVHAPGFDSIGPIDYALNKKNAYLSDVLMKHDTSSPKQQPILGHMTSCSLPLQDKTNSIQERDEDLIMDSSNLNLHSASTPLDLSQQESAAAANTSQDLLDNSSAEQTANNSQ